MTRILTFFLLIGLTFNLSAQPRTDDFGQSDPRAQEILERLSKKYKQFNTVQTEFTLHIESPDDDLNESQSGKLFLKGDKFRIELEGQTVISDNETQWTFLTDVNEVQINEYFHDEESIQPSELFTIYEKDFLYKLAEEWREGTTHYQKISLTPFDKSLNYFKIDLVIDRDNNAFVSARIFDKSGVRYTYEVRNFKGNPQLSDALFKFDPRDHPGVEVIDLR